MVFLLLALATALIVFGYYQPNVTSVAKCVRSTPINDVSNNKLNDFR